MPKTGWALNSAHPRVVAARLDHLYGPRLRRLAQAVVKAAGGDAAAAEAYVQGWSDLTEDFLRLVQTAQPDVVFRSEDGALVVIQSKRPVRVPVERLLWGAPIAPVSAWVGIEGLERGLGLSLLAGIRELIPGAAPLTPQPGHCADWAAPARMKTALALVGHAVATRTAGARGPSGSDALARVMKIFGLDHTETARLFGITRQALDHWRRQGVPVERQAKLTTLLATGELLEKNLRHGVVPGVARTPAAAYGGRTMLERIVANEHDALLHDVRESFDWAVSA